MAVTTMFFAKFPTGLTTDNKLCAYEISRDKSLDCVMHALYRVYNDIATESFSSACERKHSRCVRYHLSLQESDTFGDL